MNLAKVLEAACFNVPSTLSIFSLNLIQTLMGLFNTALGLSYIKNLKSLNPGPIVEKDKKDLRFCFVLLASLNIMVSLLNNR